MARQVKDFIRTIPGFPRDGILFRDVTPLFGSAEGLDLAVRGLVSATSEARFDKVAGIEARGFIIGSALAQELGTGFVPVRKKGKLPATTISEDYELEYGEETLEMHDDAVVHGEKVLLVDDLLATGGTAAAAARLVGRLGGKVVQVGVIIELPDLGGRSVLNSMGLSVATLCTFPGH